MTCPQPFTENSLRHLLKETPEEFILLETARTTAEDHHSYLFTQATKRLIHKAGEDPALFLQQCQRHIDAGNYIAGWFSYEFGYGLEESLQGLSPSKQGAVLANLGVYPSVQKIDHYAEPACPKSCGANSPCQVDNISLSQSADEYIRNVQHIKEYILAGDTYQVNYTLKLLFHYTGSEEELYLQLRANQHVSFGAYIKQKDITIMSFSPELFFKIQDDIITVRPMKGTIGRGRTCLEDQDNAAFLQTDLKNRAENIMIVDLLRNDLGRIAKKGTVKPISLFDVETYDSLLQMTSTIEATIADDVDLVQFFRALFPCGSVTGAPKIRTMEIINELEPEPRGVYTGAIGFWGPDGSAKFNVPIRTLVLNGQQGEMGIGSGIVADSDPENEWQECLLKGKFLTHPRPAFELIETLLWLPESGYQLLQLHLQRVQESAAYFNFSYSEADYYATLQQAAEKLSKPSKVRILLDREGATTMQITDGPPAAIFKPQPAPDSSPGRVCFAARTVSSNDPFLYHKTTNRDCYNNTLAKAVNAGFNDALFCNEKGELSEGCISTIFLRKDKVLLTPPVHAGVLPGVLRQYLLNEFPEQVKIQTLHKDDVLDPTTTLYIGNSVRGLIPVTIDTDWVA
ncbi:MAG: aminodeoxychorismate synthase component I [Desulfobulbaceae bacterium]|jgi:para-aminobenzoate synthetase/4-amino-4-deoxychorismate lyase|nr:aminodeoxychorismate synthase component I [Desulfobulbaceae bacterium]